VVIRKGKRVITVQPAVVGVTSFFGFSNLYHGLVIGLAWGQDLMKASMSALIVAASVVGMPWGNPG